MKKVAKFRYTAKNRLGKTMNGSVESSDERTAIGTLRGQGLTVLSVGLDKSAGKSLFNFKFVKKIKLPELVLFSRQLATMIDSGIPLVQGLDILTEQVENTAFRDVIRDVKKDVSAGLSFYEALGKHPQAFSPLFVNMVKAGEASGALDDIMERLATYLEKTDSLARKVRSAMIYPAVVSFMAFAITMILMIKVVPVFKSMFADFGAKLPLPTLILISVSDFLVSTFIFWVIAGVFAGYMLKRFFSSDKGSYILDKFKLDMPVFGMIMRKVAVSKFSRTLSTLIKSGVPILNALEIVAKTAANKVIEDAVNKVRVSIREGENITVPLQKVKVFPPLVVRMISVGEQSGQLEKMLNKIADFYDDQVDAAVSGLTSLIEPLIIAFLGVVIGGIVICMFMPIFKLSTVVSGNG
jgi:type IV pilus assembly protein PilC